MSDLFSQASSNASDEDEDEQELKFARCNTSPPEGLQPAKMEPVETKQPVVSKNNPELPMDRDAVPPPNLRHSPLALRHLVISIVTSFVIGALVLVAGWWFYQNNILPRLTAAPVAPASPSASGDMGAGEELAKAAEQIVALQKQVDVMRREQLLMQQNTRESLERVSSLLDNPKLVPAPVTLQESDKPGVPRMADARPDVSPTQEEFIMLKERNRLTQYADEAIATGMRKPLEVLVEYMRDSDAAHLHDAAQAEYLRAVRAIQLLQREDPGYRLPVAELFKGQNIRDEVDVKPEDLLKLLADHQQPWEVRLRVCFLLLGSPLPETNAKLIQAIKEDPSLDVAKHAQLALEQRVKRRFRIFDIPAIEEWAKSQAK